MKTSGDVLNIMLIINREFFIRANEIFNPRNSMYISRNDGKFNDQVNHKKDTIINGNTLLHLGDHVYTEEDHKMIYLITQQMFTFKQSR